MYNQKRSEVVNFFTPKLPVYFSSPRLTLLLTLLDIPPDRLPPIRSVLGHIIPLPSRLKIMDDNAFGLSSVSHPSELGVDWNTFRDFLDSDYPLALDGQKHATAASVCLKIFFRCDQAPYSWRTLRVRRFQRHRADLKPKTLWHRSVTRRLHLRTHRHRVDLKHRADLKPKTSRHQSPRFHWHFWTCLSGQVVPKVPRAFRKFEGEIEAQRIRSGLLKFLLEKAAYSDSLLKFAHRRVFRFGYLQQSHPTYMKQAIFALAKYIHRVTGETAEVRACESIWSRQRWFNAH